MTEKTSEEREQRIKELERLVVELQRSKEKWRSIVEDAPNIIIVLDREETLQFINQTVAGVTVDEAIGKKIFDYMETDHQDEIRHVIEQVYETGVPGTYEIRGLGPEGSISWYETRVGPLKSGGKVVGVTLMAVDITDRKKAENAHRKSEEKYRNLVETTNDWVWEVNPDGVYTYASPKVRDLLGYEPEEIVGKKVFDLMPLSEVAQAKKIFQDTTDTHGTVYRLEGIRLHKDGRPIVLETNGVPILDRNGRLLGYRGIDRDITARKKMEEKLQWSENLLKKTQKLARMGSFEWDLANNRAEMSDELYEIYGLTPAEFGPDDLLAQSKWVHPDDRKDVKQWMMKSSQGINVGTKEFRALLPDGTVRNVLAAWDIILDDTGKPIKIIGYNLDITERKRAEKALEKAYDDLQQEMEERKRLEKALMHEEKLKTLGAVAAEVAHEIRNPLVSIGGFAQRLKQKNSELRECDIILREAQRLEKILSRINKYLEPVEIHPEHCSVNNIIRNCIQTLTPEMAGHHVKCMLDLAPMLPSAHADPELLSQIFTYLIRNATETMLKGGELRIKSFHDERELYVEFKSHLSDMQVLNPETIFMPFSEDTQGFGLPFCFRLVKEMGGLLSYTQDANSVLFTVSLPKIVEQPEEHKETAES